MYKIIAAALTTTTLAAESEKMGFVFELVRHGARAPLKKEFCDGFPVAVGMLTP
jgi:hypothetical protein